MSRNKIQPVEKVGFGWKFDIENAALRKEKSILKLCLIILFRFYPAAIITHSMFTLSKRLNRKRLNQRRSKAKTWQMVKIVWTDSAIEDLNAIGESLVELPEPKLKKKKL